MDWFVSVWDEKTDLHHYRGGQGPDRATAIERVIAAGRALTHREDGSVVDNVGKVVIDGIPVDGISFGDPGVGDEQLRHLIGIRFDRIREAETTRELTGQRPAT